MVLHRLQGCGVTAVLLLVGTGLAGTDVITNTSPGETVSVDVALQAAKPPQKQLEREEKGAVVLPRWQTGGAATLDGQFVGFVPTIVPVLGGRHRIDIDYEPGVGKYIDYWVIIDVARTVVTVVEANHRVGHCLKADPQQFAEWDNLKGRRFTPHAGVVQLPQTAEATGNITCRFKLSFGNETYVKLHVSTSPPGATVRIENNRFGVTPLDVVVNARLFDDTALRVTLQKSGYYDAAVAYRPVVNGSIQRTLLPRKR